MTIAAPGPWIGWQAGPAAAVEFAFRAGDPAAEAILRQMPPGGARNQSLAGFFARADLAKTDQWLALARQFEAPVSSCLPLLVRMTLAGKAKEALAVAVMLPDESQANDVTIAACEVMRAWAMHDFAAAAQYVIAAPQDDSARSLLEGMGLAVRVIPAAPVLDVLTPALLGRLFEEGCIPEQYWRYLAHENLEAGLRFFDRHAGDARCRYAFAEFQDPATRRDPERLLPLLTKWVPEDPDDGYDADDGLHSGTRARFFKVTAACRPDRIAALAAGITDPKVMKIIAAELASSHPWQTISILKKLNHPAAWDTAGVGFARQHPDLLKACLPHMSEEARAKASGEKARPKDPETARSE